MQLQGEMVRLMPVSTNCAGLDCRKQAAINQCMVQTGRLSVAAGPEAGLSWGVPSGPACAQNHGSLLAQAQQLAAMTIHSDVTVLQLC